MRAATCAVLVTAAFGTLAGGVANAEASVVGMTYAKAEEALKSAGVTATIASTSGSELAQDDCIVTNQVVRKPIVTGLQSMPAKVFLSLNCYGSLATAGKPGSSAASPEGQVAKKQQVALEWRQSPDGQAWCGKAKQQHPDWFPIEGCPT